MDPTIGAAVVAGLVTVVVSVATVVLGRYFERQASIERELRQSKVRVYEDLINLLMTMLGQSSSAQELGGEQERLAWVVKEMRKLTPQMITWCGNDVLVQWSKYRREAGALGTSESLDRLAQLMFAVRRDFGHPDRGVERNDLLGLFINDIDQPQGSGKGGAVPVGTQRSAQV